MLKLRAGLRGILFAAALFSCGTGEDASEQGWTRVSLCIGSAPGPSESRSRSVQSVSEDVQLIVVSVTGSDMAEVRRIVPVGPLKKEVQVLLLVPTGPGRKIRAEAYSLADPVFPVYAGETEADLHGRLFVAVIAMQRVVGEANAFPTDGG